MDSKVQTKVAESRRTKYFIVGLLACICVLSYLLYKENTIKKELVRRKTFYLSKLYECRTASEKTDSKYRNKMSENEKLTADLKANQNAHEDTKKQFSDLKISYDSKTTELENLQRLADESKKSLTELKESYDNAVSSVKHTQGQLDEAMGVCNKHKENSESLNRTTVEITRQLETCSQEKTSLEEENQILREQIKTIQKTKSSLNVLPAAAAGNSNPPASKFEQSQVIAVGQVPNRFVANSILQRQTDQNTGLMGQTSLLTQLNTNPAHSSVMQTPTIQKYPIQISESVKEPLAQQTAGSIGRTRNHEPFPKSF